jgi:hypothetical protein
VKTYRSRCVQVLVMQKVAGERGSCRLTFVGIRIRDLSLACLLACWLVEKAAAAVAVVFSHVHDFPAKNRNVIGAVRVPADRVDGSRVAEAAVVTYVLWQVRRRRGCYSPLSWLRLAGLGGSCRSPGRSGGRGEANGTARGTAQSDQCMVPSREHTHSSFALLLSDLQVGAASTRTNKPQKTY